MYCDQVLESNNYNVQDTCNCQKNTAITYYFKVAFYLAFSHLSN